MTSSLEYEFLIAMMALVALLEVLARRIRLPPAVAFIVGGATIAVLPGVPAFGIDPELVLLVFLPPLLMSSGYFTVWTEFRANLAAISALAIGAVIFTTALVGIVAHALVPTLPWAVCFALGAVVSPPDAVAAAAVLKRLSLPSRLMATLAGESLINDASGLVLFRFAVAAALSGVFSIQEAGLTFGVLSVGGVALGFVVGHAGVWLLKKVDGNSAILVTLLLPPIAYVGGERLGVSGVLAVVTAGIILGRWQHQIVGAATRIRLQAFWDALTFLLESLIFVLIGLALHDILGRIGRTTGWASLALPIGGIVLATIIARMLWMYGTWGARLALRSLGLHRIARPSLGTATVLGWAGMRGVVTLAAALSLPAAIPGRDFVIVSAFAVILVTVLVQGTSLELLINILGIRGDEDLSVRQAGEAQARAQVAKAQFTAISALSKQEDGSELHPRLVESFSRRATLTADALEDEDMHREARSLHFSAVLEGIAAGRREAINLHRAGKIHDESLRAIEWDLDLEQLAAESHI